MCTPYIVRLHIQHKLYSNIVIDNVKGNLNLKITRSVDINGVHVL